MAIFRMKSPEEWLPKFSRGKHLGCTKIRLRMKDGSTFTLHVPPGQQKGGFEFDVTDARVVRHLTADPRFERVS